MKVEYVINKGRGDTYVEMYRGDSKADAEDRFTQYLMRHGVPDHYSETPVSKSAGYNANGNVGEFWFELVEDSE